MADVQLEHGHVRIANRLYEAMLDTEFTGAQLRIVIALIRLTYGWRRKTVTIALVELAAYARLSPAATRRDTKREAPVSGSFRRALYELIEEGVVLRLEQAGGSQLGTYAIQKDFTKWGRFSVTEARLASIWRARPQSADHLHPDPTGSPSSDHSSVEGDPAGAGRETPQGHQGRPHRVTPTGSKCDTPSQLGGRKNRKDRTNRTTSSRKGRATWITPYADAWKDRFGGKMPIEPNTRPLRDAHDALGADEALRRWTIYLAQVDAQYANGARFAATLDVWKEPPLAKSNGKHATASPAYSRGRVLLALAREYNVLTYNGNRAEYAQRIDRLCADPRAGPQIRAELAVVKFSTGLGEQTSEHFAILEIARRLEAGAARLAS